MTADRRLRIGGWAALLVAILAPLELIALFLSAHAVNPFGEPAVLVVGGLRAASLFVAVIGLDPLFRSIADLPGRMSRSAGSAGAIFGLGWAIAHAVGGGGFPLTFLGLAGGVLTGVWFIGGGTILMSAGRQLARVGWAAALGGLGSIAASVAIAVPFGGPLGTGTSWLDWFLLIGLFIVIYLVRVWSYVVRGKLPGPGIV